MMKQPHRNNKHSTINHLYISSETREQYSKYPKKKIILASKVVGSVFSSLVLLVIFLNPVLPSCKDNWNTVDDFQEKREELKKEKEEIIRKEQDKGLWEKLSNFTNYHRKIRKYDREIKEYNQTIANLVQEANFCRLKQWGWVLIILILATPTSLASSYFGSFYIASKAFLGAQSKNGKIMEESR